MASSLTRLVLVFFCLGIVAILSFWLRAARAEVALSGLVFKPVASLTSGDVRHARALIAQADELTPDVRPTMYSAALDLRLGRAAVAVDELRSVVADEPDNSEAWSLLALAARRAQDPRLEAVARRRGHMLNPLGNVRRG